MRSTMKHRSRWLHLSFAFAILCAGCNTSPQTPVDVQTAVKQSYPAWSFIGLKEDPEGECPPLENWHSQKLFEKSQESIVSIKARERENSARKQSIAARQLSYVSTSRTLEQVQADMKRFCDYRWTGAEGRARVPTGKIEGLARYDSDPMALALSAESELARMVQPRLSDHFFREVGRTGISLPIDESAPKVRLAFLDNYPTTSKDRPTGVEDSALAKDCTSNHGDFLRLLGRVMTCEDEKCATEIWSRLALAYRNFDPNSETFSERSEDCGGYFGNLGDLAQAIRDEVKAWQEKAAKQAEQKKKPSPLVLNLSLGWDGSLFGGIDKNGDNVPFCNLSSGQRAVYDALEEAHLLGALVFAATGNDRGGPAALKGPLLPAAWERITPGETDACGVARDYPLVYAVGGLRSDDQPLVNARRPGAMPSLAAYGDHAALGSSGPYWPTGTYTGTSVATAIVSSTAAVIWHANPGLLADGVMNVLRHTPTVSGLNADFGFPSAGGARSKPNPVQRVSLCSALQMAGNSAGFCCSPPKANPPLLSRLLNLPPEERWPSLEARSIARCDSSSGRSGPLNPSPDEDVECPSVSLLDLGSIPATHPQPGNDPCPNCTDPPRSAVTALSGSTEHVLYLEIAPNWPADRRLISATFETNPGGSSYFIQGPFPRGEAREVVLPSEISFGPETSTTISWRIQIGDFSYSLRTPVFIAN